MRRSFGSFALLCGLVVSVMSSPHAQTQPDPATADARLRALYTEEWAWRQKEFGRGSDTFAHVDAATQQARLAYWTKALATLDAIPFDQLSAEEKINAQVFRTSLRAQVSDIQYKTYEAPFNSDTFFWTDFTPRQGFANAAGYRSYLTRLRDVPRYFDEQIVNMQAGLARGYTVPRVSVLGRDKTIEPYIRGDASNPLYAPFAQMPANMPAAEQEALRAEALTVLRDSIVPAYSKLLAMMREDYLKKARTTLGASAMPDGRVFYQAQIEKHTTLTLTPKEIHDIGLKEVARLEAEMRAVKDQAGFKGSMPEFFKFLRSDPQFYAKTPRELLSLSAYVAKKADDKLSTYFGLLPRRRHGIRPVPEILAPIYTGGRGGLETCLMNTYNLPARPLYTIPPLTLHECTPGHSFQAALAQEGPSRPPFRNATGFSGYGEGWGLYMEFLGKEMGIYETPYEDFGRLTYEMWRACRLVIDTGIHEFGWTRDQALAYLRDRAPLAEHEITTEIDRYIAWPGQALAYKLGEIQIRRHRKEAEERLGARFDIRRFHDRILAMGSVPLPVLEQQMNQFIADELAAPTSTTSPPFPFETASIPELQAAMQQGRITSRQLVTHHLTRIGLYEDRLNAAIAINANALVRADALDRERAAGHVRGPLHGIPVAVKDNILTKDDLPTSGGMLAFKNYMAPYEATLVTHLVNAGAIILAKSTMSELAGWFGDSFRPGGYNGAAGQSFNPYDPRAKDDGTPLLDTSGSSSGGGVAAGLWAANVGTSTGGSIEGPSNATMLVGIRPSTGRISRHGIIPLSLDQDTAGPMTKSVTDAAVMLGVLEGDPDPNDARTSECQAPPNHDYTAFLKADALKGARIGVPRAGYYEPREFPGTAKPFRGLRPDEKQSMEDAIAALRAAGAEIVDPADLPSMVATDPAANLTSHNICELLPAGTTPDDLCSTVLRYGMKRDFNLWLATLGASAPVKTLAELRAWNAAHKDAGAIRYGQGRLDAADAVDVEKDRARYERNRREDLALTREQGLDAALKQNKLDALLFPGSSGANYATKAGYPIIAVPFGMVINYDEGAKGSTEKVRPFGVTFVGAHCDDPKLVGIAYAFEQATHKRVPPRLR